MIKVIDLLRSIFISFEFVIILLMSYFLFYNNRIIVFLTNHLSFSSDILKYFAILPIAILGLLIKEIWPLLFPEFDKKRILQSWPNYYQLKIRIIVAILYSFLFAIAGASSWFVIKIDSKTILILVIGSIIGTCIVYISTFMAKIKINEIFCNENSK